MPVFKQHLIVDIARGVRAFLNLEAGVTRGGATTTEPLQTGQELEKTRRELASKDRELAELRARLIRSGTETGVGGINPGNIVWIFGTGRSGNTWLSSMMEGAGHAVWKEPAIGKLFGEFYNESRKGQRRSAKFVLGDPRQDIWLGSIRRFVLEGASGRFPELSEEDYLVVKEQVGSIGAPLLTEALPESRMIFLIRDPRDVVASWLDGARRSGWHHERVAKNAPDRVLQADENPNAYVEQQAQHYLKNVGKAAEAYAAHKGNKILVRYEQLRADTLREMRRIHSTLGIAVDDEALGRSVWEHSWENIPEEEKGEGKFYRRATPGSWENDLTPEQAWIVEEITAPLLNEFYPRERQDEKLPEKSRLN